MDRIYETTEGGKTGDNVQGGREAAITAVLDALLVDCDGRGAAIVGRDGVAILRRFAARCNEEAVCAMGAAILGAADAVFAAAFADEVTSVIATARAHRYYGLVIDTDTALILATSAKREETAVLERMAGAVQAIEEATKGG